MCLYVPAHRISTPHHILLTYLTPTSYNIVVVLSQGIKAVDIEVEGVEEVTELVGEGGSRGGLGTLST